MLFQQFLLKRMSVFSHKMVFIKNEAALLCVISGTVQGHLQQQSSVQLFDVAFSIKKSTISHHQPKYTHHQPKYIHHHPLTLTSIHHHPPPAKIYPPLPINSKKMDPHPTKAKIYSYNLFLTLL